MKFNLLNQVPVSYREGTTSDIDQILEVQKEAIKDIWVGEKYGITE